MKQHWSIKYVFDKIKNKYLANKEKESPWLPFDCVKFLKQYLSKDDIFLETGSGNSTIWFSRLVKKVVSIEHHSEWYKLINERINNRGVKNIDYFMESKDYSDNPANSAYVNRVASFEDNYFDIILVDGKHRSQIALLALAKIKNHGLIIVDNAERYMLINPNLPEGIKETSQMTKEWSDFTKRTDQFRKVAFSDGITSTIIIFINKED
jgi:predicted O-methyltransferase YrrM